MAIPKEIDGVQCVVIFEKIITMGNAKTKKLSSIELKTQLHILKDDGTLGAKVGPRKIINATPEQLAEHNDDLTARAEKIYLENDNLETPNII